MAQTKQQFMTQAAGANNTVNSVMRSAGEGYDSNAASHAGSGTTTSAGPATSLNVMVHPPDLGMTGKNANYIQFV